MTCKRTDFISRLIGECCFFDCSDKMVDSSSDDDIMEEEESSNTLLHAVDIRAAKIKRRLQPVGEIIGTWGL